MAAEIITTEFAPAERVHPEILKRQAYQVGRDAVMRAVVGAMPEIVLILNSRRQVVFANSTALAAFSLPSIDGVLGKRPGELLDCVHVDDEPAGCGTTMFCQTCGAVRAILSSLNGSEDVQECRVSQKSGDALDLRVWTTPLTVEGERYSIFAMKDIGDEKRRVALERVFFHDVMNTASLITSYGFLIEQDPQDASQLISALNHAAQRLIEEIRTQRQLLDAEQGELHVDDRQTDAESILEAIGQSYFQQAVVSERHLRVVKPNQRATLMTDAALLGRVIGNMVKNAIEACKEAETVTVSYSLTPSTVVFSVHNPGVMPRNVQLQVFNRSFSTKGNGRGLGTYSMKLLSERYLNGRVWFYSEVPSGTTFYAEFPRL